MRKGERKGKEGEFNVFMHTGKYRCAKFHLENSTLEGRKGENKTHLCPIKNRQTFNSGVPNSPSSFFFSRVWGGRKGEITYIGRRGEIPDLSFSRKEPRPG